MARILQGMNRAPVVAKITDPAYVQSMLVAHRVTQRELAEEWKTDPTTVSHYVAGRRTIPYRWLEDLGSRIKTPVGRFAEIKLRGGCPHCVHCTMAADSLAASA